MQISRPVQLRLAFIKIAATLAPRSNHKDPTTATSVLALSAVSACSHRAEPQALPRLHAWPARYLFPGCDRARSLFLPDLRSTGALPLCASALRSPGRPLRSCTPQPPAFVTDRRSIPASAESLLKVSILDPLDRRDVAAYTSLCNFSTPAFLWLGPGPF